MKLSELFPDIPKLMLNGAEHELIFNVRAMLQLEKYYPETDALSTNEQLANVLNKAFGRGMSMDDVVNFLHAGLIHTKCFTRDSLIDAMQRCDISDYIDNIVEAYRLGRATPEQLEQIAIMVKANGGQKKTTDLETTLESTPIIV